MTRELGADETVSHYGETARTYWCESHEAQMLVQIAGSIEGHDFYQATALRVIPVGLLDCSDFDLSDSSRGPERDH